MRSGLDRRRGIVPSRRDVSFAARVCGAFRRYYGGSHVTCHSRRIVVFSPLGTPAVCSTPRSRTGLQCCSTTPLCVAIVFVCSCCYVLHGHAERRSCCHVFSVSSARYVRETDLTTTSCQTKEAVPPCNMGKPHRLLYFSAGGSTARCRHLLPEEGSSTHNIMADLQRGTTANVHELYSQLP